MSPSLATATYCLTLPGKKLHLSSLLALKKFRNKGNKDGAIAAFKQLELAGLGKLDINECHRGTSAVRRLHVRLCTVYNNT